MAYFIRENMKIAQITHPVMGITNMAVEISAGNKFRFLSYISTISKYIEIRVFARRFRQTTRFVDMNPYQQHKHENENLTNK